MNIFSIRCAFQEALMQQPLTHLYFLIILDSVSELQFGLSGLITTSQKISKVLLCTVWVCPLVRVDVC